MLDPRPKRQRDIEHITRLVPSLASQEQNDLLMRPISLVEVEAKIFHMEVGKALGLDGFGVKFFHHFWYLIKLEVRKIAEDSRVSRKIFPALNAMLLTLIQKCEGEYSPGNLGL